MNDDWAAFEGCRATSAYLIRTRRPSRARGSCLVRASRATTPPAGHASRAAWIFGAACPARDIGVALIMQEASTAAMQLVLEELASAVGHDAHAILILDRAGWHIAKRLVWPPNVTRLHLTLSSPELNPIDRVRFYLRERFLSHREFEDAEAIIDACCQAWNALLAEMGRVRSLAAFPWASRVNP